MEVLTIEEAIKYLESKGVPELYNEGSYFYYKNIKVGFWSTEEYSHMSVNYLYTPIVQAILTKKNIGLVSQKENSQNRRSYKNENNPASKINKEIANKIRELYKSKKSYQKLANEFSISKTLVANIIRNQAWI